LPKKRWTYFNETAKARKVDEFCAWYLSGNADKVRTWNTVKKRLSQAEKAELARLNPTVYRQPTEHLASWEEEEKSRLSRFRDSLTTAEVGLVPLQLPDPPDFIDEKKEDERFKNLRELVHRYSDIIPSTDEQREKEIIPELWTLIGLLSEEKRFGEGATFKLEPYKELELQRLEALITNLQTQFSNTDKFLERNLPAYIAWKRTRP
jgi:hypothetical protein